MRPLVGFFVLVAAAVGLLFLAEQGMGPVVIVHADEQKIFLRLGRVSKVKQDPGLWYQIPLIDEVRTYSKRLLYRDAEPILIPTRDEERLVVDNYIIWRISDPVRFLEAFPLGMTNAVDTIDRVLKADVREVIGQRTVREVVTDARVEIMQEIAEQVGEGLEPYGIEVTDVRINRTELPEKVTNNVYARMRAERERLARKYRAEGDEEARRIRAEADREASVVVAEAKRDAEILRGEGDAEATRIYAEAYTRDPEFYEFTRSLEAYKRTIGANTTLIVPPDTEFFRLFQDADNGRSTPRGGAPAPPVE